MADLPPVPAPGPVPPDGAATTPTDAALPRRRGRTARMLATVAGAVLLLLGSAAAGLAWSLTTAPGTAWLLSVLPGVQASGVRGALLGDFDVERLVVTLGLGDQLTLQSAGWRGVDVGRAASGWRLRVALAELHADRVELRQTPRPDPPAPPPRTAPTDLRLPIEVEIGALRIGEVGATALGAAPLRDIAARIHVGAADGAEHRVDGVSLTWDRLVVRGDARIATAAPLALAATVDLVQRADVGAAVAAGAASGPAGAASAPSAAASAPTFSAHATLAGPLMAPTLQATMRARAGAGRPAQALDARATLRPFAAWPLGDLQATARGLDLAAFGSAAPTTALDLDARAASTGLDQPASVTLVAVNTAPGRRDEGRLPLRRLELELKGRPDDTSTLDLATLAVDFGNRTAAAGRLVGTGRWTRTGWNLDATLDALQPALLDAAAPPMRLSGPVKVAGATGAGPSASASAGGAATTIDLAFDLAGVLAERGPGRAVQLQLDARIDPLHVALRRARAAAGAAQATLQGDLTRVDAAAPWALKGRAALVDFDPSTWWPGAADAPAWRKGPHRLNARGDFDLLLPADAAQRPATALLAAVRGDASVRLEPSLLAGVPLSGRAEVRSTDGHHAVPLLQLDAAGNTIRAEGRVDLRRSDDHWDLRIAAPALARLAPLYRLLQPGAPVDVLDGTLQLGARVTGRWPDLVTDGNLDATGLHAGTTRVQRVEARWQAGTRADAVIDVQAWLTGAEFGGRAVVGSGGRASAAASPAGGSTATALESLALQLKGTGRAHQLELRAESKALPPAWTDALLAAAPAGATAGPAPPPPTATAGPAAPPASAAAGPSTAATALPAASSAAAVAPPPFASAPGASTAAAATGLRTLAVLLARGGLVDAGAASPAGWRGSVQQIDLRSSARGAPALVAARDVGIEALWAGGPARVTVQPGRATLLGAGLRWSRIAWAAAEAGAAPARIDAQAELDAVPVAPLLAKLQPDFGWGGDLAIGGRLNLRSTPTFSADVVLERIRGDLTVTDETSRQSLGLTELRFSLAAANGVWKFGQALAGRTVGTAAGAVTVRTTPQALWPTPDSPIDGGLQLQVANLGTWGNWVPAGWRLDGALDATAAIGGRFGAPEYTGRVEGSKLGVRNFLQGVNVRDGEVRVALQGTTARIERFVAKAGDGSLALTGTADLGAAPKAELTVTAERFELLGRVDRRIVASGQARLQFDRDRLGLDGNFDVDEGLIDFTRSDAPALGSDVVVMRGPRVAAPTAPNAGDAPAPASTTAPPPPPSARKTALDLRVTLGQKLRVKGRGLDTGLRGELRVTSPGGKLAVNGTVSTAEGSYQAYGQKLKIDRGQITFLGSTDNPRLDIEATRPDTDDVRVGVAVTGTTLNPRIRLFSEPDLSEVDKLSWLVMGRASSSLGRADTALLQRAALALLSGEGPGKTEQITKAIGLDEISLRQTDGDVRETVISLGKQLSKRWYVGYERGLNATAGNWQLIYRIAQRFTLRAQSGLDNSLDLIWTWRWQ